MARLFHNGVVGTPGLARRCYQAAAQRVSRKALGVEPHGLGGGLHYQGNGGAAQSLVADAAMAGDAAKHRAFGDHRDGQPILVSADRAGPLVRAPGDPEGSPGALLVCLPVAE